MKSKVINIASNRDDYTLEIKDRLINILQQHGYDYHDGFSSKGELNITIGGDGAFLRSVRESNFSTIPFIGINTGTLGFYPELTPENLESFVSDYAAGNYTINSVNLIESEIKNYINKPYQLKEFSTLLDHIKGKGGFCSGYNLKKGFFLGL